MNSISAIIVAKDNPPHIFESIKSIQYFAKEILIADIGIDSQLRKRLSAIPLLRFIDISRHVPYVEIIREELRQQTKEEWVLFLDPDEIVSEKLIDLLKSSTGKYDYVKIPRKNIIFGKWIEHSRWWPDYQVRFFKKNAVVWPTEIHKQPKVTGIGLTLEPNEENAIMHFNYESIDEYMLKAIRYARSEAHTNIKNKVNLTLLNTIRLSVSEFVSRFFGDDGYKDGIRGFTLAILQMFYPLLVYFYFLEQKKFKINLTEKELLDSTSYFFSKLHKESLFWKNKKDSISLKEKIIEKIIG